MALLQRGQGRDVDADTLPLLAVGRLTDVEVERPESSSVITDGRQLRQQSSVEASNQEIVGLVPNTPSEEPPSLVVGAVAGAVATGAASVLGPMLVKSEPMAPFRDAVTSMVSPISVSYCIPVMSGMPKWLLHWSHGGNTGTALLVVAGLGVAAGLDIRRRRSEGKLASGEPEVIDHGTAMVFALLIALVGASGGLASTGFDRQPLLESPNAWAAIVSVVLLVGNGLLSTSIAGRRPAAASGPSPRYFHAQVGSVWLASVAASAVLGLGLGTSYETLASVDERLGTPEAYSTSPLQLQEPTEYT